ncbi:MAG: GspH/FimT family pseudopilin [Deltaproteobacteria bacterium]|nr:GspH/FimT family pseudopilin [Deltaproteobacteria bacterium]
MKGRVRAGKNSSGFTLMEIIVTCAILAILAAVAIPAFSSWLPEYRLKSAVRDLYSNTQLARVMAIKNNESYRMIFITTEDGAYIIQKPDGTTERTINFLDYDSNGNIGYGGGNATKSATKSGGSIPTDGVSYGSNVATFNPRGLGSSGYVYLANSTGTAYAIGRWSSGIIVLKKWNNSTNSWE